MDENNQLGVQHPVVTTPPVPQQYAPAAVPPPQKSKTWLWVTLGIVGGLLLLLGALFVIAYPSLQARAVATAYMDAVKTNDETELKRLSGDGASAFTTSVSEKLKDATYDISTAKPNDKGYVVNFDVKGSSSIRTTTVVILKGKVDTFLVNAQGASKTENTELSTPAPTSSCLTASDLKSNGITYIEDESLGEKTFFGDLFFNADSTNYRSDSIAAQELGKAANLYKNTSDKDYGFSVQGSVYQAASTSGGVQLAKERSQKVKDQLVSLGVSADKVTVLEPTNGAYDAEAARNITLFLTVPSTCKSDTSAM
jgi:outer membrane protein OmpA-like peptidoglycan-associated protein